MFNIIMQRTANENAACSHRIFGRSDQPKKDRIANNDARLILRRTVESVTGQRHESQELQLWKIAILGFQYGLYHVVSPLGFLRRISLASLFVNT